MFDVEGEVGDVVLGELVFELFACGAPLGNEGYDAGRWGLADRFQKVDPFLLGREELLRGERLPGPYPHETEHCYQKGVSIQELNELRERELRERRSSGVGSGCCGHRFVSREGAPLSLPQ